MQLMVPLAGLVGSFSLPLVMSPAASALGGFVPVAPVGVDNYQVADFRKVSARVSMCAYIICWDKHTHTHTHAHAHTHTHTHTHTLTLTHTPLKHLSLLCDREPRPLTAATAVFTFLRGCIEHETAAAVKEALVPYLVLNVRRDHLLQDTLNILSTSTEVSWRPRLRQLFICLCLCLCICAPLPACVWAVFSAFS